MFRDWNLELNQFIFLLAVGATAGWLLGFPGVGVALVTVPYSFWMLFRLKALVGWLQSGGKDEPPESGGIWGRLFDNLYQIQQANKQQISELNDIIVRAQQSTNAIADGVVVVDKFGALDWWNEAGGKFLGLRLPADKKNPLVNLLRDPRFIRYFKSKNYSNPITIPSSQNPNQMLQFEITLFGEGERLIVVRDVTRLTQLEQMRKDFVANVSHELRTPLTVVKGYLETFLDLISGNPQLERGLQQMHNQTQRMELLINDLLMLSRLETDTELKTNNPVSAPALIRQIYNDGLAVNDNKQHEINLEIDESLDICGDVNELRSAFSNLLVNAINYTPEQGNIVVRWYQDETGIFMEVEDDGIGIDSKHIPRLTERFYRADEGRDAKSGGTGLGLAIVKHVLIHHNANLEIISNLGEGSLFRCRFPVSAIAPKKHKSVA